MKLTLVTAFFRIEGRPVDEEEMLQRFDLLSSCDLPITAYIDARMMAERGGIIRRSNVTFIPLILENHLPKFRDSDAELTLPEHRNQEKDTRDFLLLQNSKLDFLDMTRRSDPDSTHFAWIDFGIMKIVRNPEAFLERLRRLSPPATCVLAPGCWSREQSDRAIGVDWRFCGGFLLVDRNSVEPLKRICDSVFERGMLTWEVNVWASAERYGARFDWYKADHDDSIIMGVPWKPACTRICLVMIVKNEGKIIERCLTSALPFIDTWCIADTGSTDGTGEIIEAFFKAHSVRGELFRTTFKNFAQARNEALERAKTVPGWDYALLLDADMVLEGRLDPAALTAPAYDLIQRNGSLNYANTRMVRRDVPAQYFGVTHEYLSVEGVQHYDGLVIDDRNDGGSKGDKGPRDIRLLNEGLSAEPNNERYMFYLAQVYREMGRHHEAIQWYTRRIARGGWDEEIWASYYGIARSYKELGDTPNFIMACVEAYNYRPSRGESLKLLAEYYRSRSQSEAAMLIAETLAEIPYPGDRLFVERHVYEYGAAEELAVSGFYSKQPRLRRRGYRACADLTTVNNGSIRESMRRDFTHYAKSAKELFGAETREIDWKPSDGWAPMNPSVVGCGSARLVLVRTVNYIVADGQYPTIDGSGIIRTHNHIVEMNEEWRPIMSTLIEDITGTPRTGFPVEGYEDCRLWAGPSSYFVSATVRDLSGNIDGRCEMAISRLDTQWRIDNTHVVRDYEYNRTQKNWMPIVSRHGSFLYLCDPTVVIEDTENGTVELARHQAPACLVDLRGGSQLIPHHDGWLCVTHEVAWRPERVYLHRFVRFDADFKIIGLSDPFYFEKIGIEFCAGLARDGSTLVASFGVNDASAHLAFFDPESIDQALRSP